MLFNLFRPEPHSQKTIKALWKLEKIILDTLDFNTVVKKIVDSVLVELGYLNLGYRIIVLILFDDKTKTLKRISLSETEEAHKLLAQTKIPFPQMDIPLSAKDNLCVKVFENMSPQRSTYWPDFLCPPFTKEDALYYQNLAGIKSSKIYPILSKGKALGVIIFSLVKPLDQVTSDEEDLIQSFTDVVGLAVQNATLYTSLETTTRQLAEANQKLQDANVKLQELDKLKDEFVSLASHELRTPMTAIKGSISTILDGYAGEISKEARDFLTSAYNENDRLIRMVRNYLNISKIESGTFTYTVTKIDLVKVIADVIHNHDMAAKEKNLYLKYEESNDLLPQVDTDVDVVKEVLINFIGNALKFTHQGGITIKSTVKEGKIITGVTDTGSGIAKEDQAILFQKFVQVGKNYSKQAGGTGLGLYISKIMIEGLKGEVWFESELGKGSTFFFSLPIASQ